MKITSATGREFNRDVGKAKRDAATGPGLITDLGLKITGKEESIVELLAMPEAADIDFEPPRLHCAMYRTADLSCRTTIT